MRGDNVTDENVAPLAVDEPDEMDTGPGVGYDDAQGRDKGIPDDMVDQQKVGDQMEWGPEDVSGEGRR